MPVSRKVMGLARTALTPRRVSATLRSRRSLEPGRSPAGCPHAGRVAPLLLPGRVSVRFVIF